MKILKLAGCNVELFTSVDEMPIDNYINFTRLSMLQADIGSDIEAINRHFGLIVRMVRDKDEEGLKAALANYQNALFFVASNTSPEMLSFVALIKSIDGKQVEDYSDESAKQIVEKLSKEGLIVKVLRSTIETIKKKLTPNLKPTN